MWVVGISHHSPGDRLADVDFARGVVRSLVVAGHRVAADPEAGDD
jgi:hypothetical protein